MCVTRQGVSRAIHTPLIISLCLVLGAVAPGIARADAQDAVCPAQTGWLQYFNSFRTVANIANVTEDTTQTQGDCNHSRYVVKNPITHVEDPANLWYTASGAYAGVHSNVASVSGPGAYTFQNAINGWMTGPFHEIGILDPRLTAAAFAIYTEGDADGATLDVLTNLGGPAPVAPVYFPANGTTMILKQFDGGESPNPLSGCAGYTAPTGPPLALQLLTTPAVTAFSFSKVGVGALPVCEFDGSNYVNPDNNGADQSIGRAILSGRNAIILMPQASLTNGIYQVSVTSNGNTYAWSFTFGPALQSIAVTPANTPLPVNGTVQLTATGTYADASTQNLTGQVTWASLDTNVATVTAGGLVTLVGQGSTTITATFGARSGNATVRVAVNPLPTSKPNGNQDGGSPRPLPGNRPPGNPSVGPPNPLPPPRPGG